MKPQKYKDEYRAQKRRKRIVKTVVILVAVFIFLAGTVYALFFAKLLDVRSVSLNGAETVEQADLESSINNWLDAGVLGIKRRSDSFFFSTSKLTSHLMAQFPRLSSVLISRKLPHGLEVSVAERKPIGVWCLSKAGRCFFFDKNALAYAETSGSSGFLITTISDRRDREITLGSPVVSGGWFDNIISAKELLLKAGVSVAEFEIPADSYDEFDAKTAEGLPGQGWKIMFSNATNVEEQVSALNTFLKEKISPEQRAKLQYVDLRIQDRIYYK